MVIGVLTKPLREIEEIDLQGLAQGAIPEGLTLEFKRELNLDDSKQKKEAAKDVSALANTVGGRLFYGIDEAKLPDGSAVAGGIVPLTDGSVASRLADVLHSAIHPRARFDFQAVNVNGGHVLVVEVYSSNGIDLHLVSAYGESRFYKRGPTGTVLMTEPEIREAYIRVGELRASLESRVESLTRSELSIRSKLQESILVVPLYSRPNLMDPRQVRHLDWHLQQNVLHKMDLGQYIGDLKLRYDGYRLLLGGPPEEAALYIAVLKTGVIHFSTDRALFESESGKVLDFLFVRAAHRILQSLAIAREVLGLCSYFGPVRPIPPGTYRSEVAELNLEHTFGSWGLIVKELLDPVFHAWGDYECETLFNEEGVLHKKWTKDFSMYSS